MQRISKALHAMTPYQHYPDRLCVALAKHPRPAQDTSKARLSQATAMLGTVSQQRGAAIQSSPLPPCNSTAFRSIGMTHLRFAARGHRKAVSVQRKCSAMLPQGTTRPRTEPHQHSLATPQRRSAQRHSAPAPGRTEQSPSSAPLFVARLTNDRHRCSDQGQTRRNGPTGT